jgi:spermidine synthase
MTGFNRRTLIASLGAAALVVGASPAQAVQLIEKRESRYNTIYIVRDGPLISMLFGVNKALFTESSYDPARPNFLASEYTRAMTMAVAYAADPKAVLEIGLGGGRTAVYLRDHIPGAVITCVEIDPEVIALARKHFDVAESARLKMVSRDGRVHLTQSKERYDLILIDAYRGTFVPFHLTTQEFFQMAKRRLKPGGAIAQNIAPNVLLTDAMVATLKSVFDHVDTYEIAGSVVAIAYDGAQMTDAVLRARADAAQKRFGFAHALPDLAKSRQVAAAPNGRVLKDDFAPVEALRSIERHNEKR